MTNPPRKSKQGKWPLLLALGLVFLAGVARGEPAVNSIQVRVVPMAEVMGSSFVLGDVAELDGFDIERVKKLAAISIGKSPRAGQHLGLNESLLRTRLGRTVDLEGVEFLVPKDAQVVRASQVIPAAEVGRVVMETAARIAGGDPESLRQEIIGTQGDVVLPRGEVNWEVTALGSALTPGGTRSFRIIGRVGDEEGWRGLIRVGQSVTAEVVVAKRPIRRNQVIEAEDVGLDRADVARMKQEMFLTDLTRVVGSKAQRPIGPGEWISAALVRAPMDVKEGGRVMVVYASERLNLNTPGVAMTHGRVGDFIPVRNLQTGRVVYGIIQPNETVKVN
ncbi:MAG: flagellar basal body P-ring formation chaperone FlgA [Deltaproteobacteria bacterium]|nr:flagellar basal body P-ring formation chaperone FlgA [Deltaproteobacteria bacterium]